MLQCLIFTLVFSKRLLLCFLATQNLRLGKVLALSPARIQDISLDTVLFLPAFRLVFFTQLYSAKQLAKTASLLGNGIHSIQRGVPLSHSHLSPQGQSALFKTWYKVLHSYFFSWSSTSQRQSWHQGVAIYTSLQPRAHH